MFGNGSSNGDIIKLLFSKVFFSDFRGGPVDSTEELPVKIQVLFHMMVYLLDECLKKDESEEWNILLKFLSHRSAE